MARQLLCCLSAIVTIAGCAGPPRPHPSWAEDERRITPGAVEAERNEQRADLDAAAASLASRTSHPLNVLVLSTGGQNGAFGAGVLKGWDESGERPEFDLVTGTSTGALMAVFAFLGTEGNAALEAMYTTHITSDVYTPYPWVSVLSSSAYAASTPLRSTVARYVTEDVVKTIGREGARGRVLLISTANLDLNTLRMWNMTALAADEKRPIAERTRRFRDILMASLSIPSLVPPVFVDDCMHADGGVIAQLFIPENLREVLTPNEAPGPSVWVVVNRRLGSPPRVVRNQIIPIATRSVQMMIDAGLTRDLADVKRFTESCRGRFSLASLPTDPSRREPQGFLDPVYMKQVHALGVSLGRSGKAWTPPPSLGNP